MHVSLHHTFTYTLSRGGGVVLDGVVFFLSATLEYAGRRPRGFITAEYIQWNVCGKIGIFGPYRICL